MGTSFDFEVPVTVPVAEETFFESDSDRSVSILIRTLGSVFSVFYPVFRAYKTSSSSSLALVSIWFIFVTILF